MVTKKFYPLLLLVVVLGGAALFLFSGSEKSQSEEMQITNFEQCVAAGNPVMESYPRQCRTPEGKVFAENIGNELEKTHLIRVASPRANETIQSPLLVSGEARGYWHFEATFPVILVDWDGRIIAEWYAEAQDEWMTEDFVPFEAQLSFDSPFKAGDPDFMKRGALILHKANASGLPEHDDALEIPILFAPAQPVVL